MCVFPRVLGSWRQRLPGRAEAAAALNEAPRRRGQVIVRVEARPGRVRAGRADPPPDLSVHPG